MNVIDLDAQRAIAYICKLEISFIKDALKLIDEKKAYEIIIRPKKSGGKRIIHKPDIILLVVQEQLLQFFYELKIDHKHMFGGIPDKKLVDNALVFSKDKAIPKCFLRLDLKDAYPSVTNKILKQTFISLFNLEKFIFFTTFFVNDIDNKELVYKKFIELLIKLVTVNGKLPQGAPTSLYLLNMVLVWSGIIDDLEKICQKRSPAYIFSIYVDDIIFSTPIGKKGRKRIFSKRFINKLILAIEKNKYFKINPKKTRLIYSKKIAPNITGIILTRRDQSFTNYLATTIRQKKQNIYRRKIYWATKLLNQNILPTKEKDGFSINQIIGYINWTKQATAKNPIPSRLRKMINNFELSLKTYKQINGKNII